MAVKKYYHDIDLDNNQLISAVIENRASAPSSPVDGQVYFNTTDKKVYYYNSATTSWKAILIEVAGSSVPTDASQANWNTAYGWGDHASAGYQVTSQKGAANGYASLDSGGKVPASQLPSSLMEYKGVWNASTNTPTLANGTGDTGDVYRVSVSGIQNLGSGNITFDVGDYVIYNGTVWEKSDTTDAVSSVNGLTGAVTLSFISSLGVSGSLQTGASQTLATGTTGTDFGITSSGNTHTFNIPSASASARGLITTSTQTIAGDKTFTGTTTLGVTYLSGSEFQYLLNSATQIASQTVLGSAGVLVQHRVLYNIAGTSLLSNASALTFYEYNQGGAYVTASSGTHALVAYRFVKGLTINANATTPATVTNAATLYIENSASGTATITNNYAIWVDNGTVRLDGAFELQGIAAATGANMLYYDATTKRVTYGAAPTGTGSVQSVSVVSANGFAGTVATSTTTPAITLTTTITGLLKGNGTAISAAVAGTDYLTSAVTQINFGTTGLTPASASFGNITVAGTLVAANGGTGQSTYTIGDILYASASTTLSKLAAVAAGSYLRSAGTGTAPVWSTVTIPNAATLGDIWYGSAANVVSALAGNTAATKQYLSQTGNGTVSAAPSWSAIAGADVTGAALTKTDDTNVTLTLGGTPATSLLRAASLTLGWTGTLAVGRGGTGASTLTGVLIGNGTSAVTAVTGTASQLLRRNAGDTAYEFFTPTYLTANQSITLSGDVSGTGTTAITTTIGANKVTNAMLAQVATGSFLGRVTAATGNVETLTGTQATTLLDTFTSTLKGLVPSPAGATTTFLRADGTWAAPSGSGTVTTLSVVSANGFAGTVANATSTPAITISTTVTGVLKGNGTAISAAVANTDYLAVADPAYTGALTTGTLTFTPANHFAALVTSSALYNQLITQNSSNGAAASNDIVVNNNISTDSANYGDFGINSSNYAGSGSFSLGNATYLYAHSGDLAIGTFTSNAIHFVINNGTADAATIKTTGQLQLPGYTTTTSFSGTAVGFLAFDSSGNIITTASPTGGYTVTSQTSNYTETATSGTKIIKCSTAGGSFTVTLPTAVGNTATLIIKKTAGSANLIVDGAGTETIDGGLTATIVKVDESITLVSDNTNWLIV